GGPAWPQRLEPDQQPPRLGAGHAGQRAALPWLRPGRGVAAGAGDGRAGWHGPRAAPPAGSPAGPSAGTARAMARGPVGAAAPSRWPGTPRARDARRMVAARP